MRLLGALVWLSAAACDEPLPEESDFILIPEVVDASGEATTQDPPSITLRMRIHWVNGEDAPETHVAVDGRVGVEDDDTQDFLGRVLLEPIDEFDNVLGPEETASIDYEGTQSPPAPEVQLERICDEGPVHLQVEYSTHGSLADFPTRAISNAFVVDCD